LILPTKTTAVVRPFLVLLLLVVGEDGILDHVNGPFVVVVVVVD
jgi:hypothetical protein